MTQHNNERINGENEAIADHGEGFPPGTSETARISGSDLASDGRYITTDHIHGVRKNRHKWTKEDYDTLIECHERVKLERSRGVGRRTLKFWMEKNICPMSENKLMNQVRVVRRKGYLTGVEISRISESLRDPADGLQRMVGVECRVKGGQEEQGSGDGAGKDEEQERYTVNPDIVVGGHAEEMNQLDNELLEIQRRLTNLMNAPEENNLHEYEKGR
ncbi:Hypothetical predicted protein [Octopus vulgaris]|uniref:Uncharacterized protein n=1 Tax=Octopus vulgaris TaxID=6645 RepID=A0AA36EX20_OCTVU|nr:Hypothetical predicted protein [Octopus vulgaris]